MNCFNFYVRWGVGKKLWFYEKANQEIRELCNLLVRIFFGGTDMVRRFPSRQQAIYSLTVLSCGFLSAEKPTCD